MVSQRQRVESSFGRDPARHNPGRSVLAASTREVPGIRAQDLEQPLHCTCQDWAREMSKTPRIPRCMLVAPPRPPISCGAKKCARAQVLSVLTSWQELQYSIAAPVCALLTSMWILRLSLHDESGNLMGHLHIWQTLEWSWLGQQAKHCTKRCNMTQQGKDQDFRSIHWMLHITSGCSLIRTKPAQCVTLDLDCRLWMIFLRIARLI